jgi:hypothetical protein
MESLPADLHSRLTSMQSLSADLHSRLASMQNLSADPSPMLHLEAERV